MRLLIKVFISIVVVSCLVYGQNSNNLKIQELLKKSKQTDNTARVDVLNELSFLFYRESTPLGIEYGQKAYTFAKGLKYSMGEAIALRNIGFGYYLTNKLDSAEISYNKSIEILELLHDIKEKAVCYNNYGLIFWRKGESIKAFENYRKAQNLSEKVHDSLEISRSLNYIGLVYWKWGDLTLSLDYFTQALKIKESLNDSFEIAVTLNNMANIYNELKEYNESLKYANRALKLSEAINDKYSQGRALNNIGVSYYKMKNYDKAKDIQLKSLQVKETSGDKSGIGYSFSSLGDIYFDLKNFTKAIEYYEKSLEIRKDLHDNYGISSVLISIGKTYQKLGNNNLALEHYNKSLQIAQTGLLKEVEMNNYLALSNLYENFGDTKKALNYFRQYHDLKDSIYTKETRDKLAELRINFESEKKEKEISLLIKENELRQLQINKQSQRYNILITISVFGILMTAFYFYFQNKRKLLLEEKNRNFEVYTNELKELNASKDKFFSIVAHDLKSPFHGLLGFSGLLADELDTLSKDQVRRYVNNIKTSTRNVYGLIENLLDWSRIQIGRSEFVQQKTDVKEEVDSVINLLFTNAQNKDIRLISEVNAGTYINADRKMVQSIFQNLITNAIKFTYPGGKIKINADQSGADIEIRVSDSGIGISKENIERVFKIDTQFTTVGTAEEKGTGLGLLLCKEMVEKHGGKIRVESELNIGSTFILTLPKFIN